MLQRLSRLFSFTPKQVVFKDWNIVRGDKVEVISGKDKGKQGTVLMVKRKFNTVIVSGVNYKVKHMKYHDRLDNGKVRKEFPLHVSNVMLVDPETGKRTRTRDGFLETGEKVRIAKKSGAMIPKPVWNELTYKERHKNIKDGPKDTPPEIALKQTYEGINKEAIKAEFEKWVAEREKEAAWLIFPE
ncbi:hypothetical protein SteCoe_8455 [Stentor coeruleus]|uniref:Large ribosomal subunit protein uL24c n=1 Tax=Stentor coeruleus TaxID=5963 RepID=A0A1R2CK88_9CILI|nr:hypothetical protein SteCoe_8455 [Stentor coeruleus]